HASYFPAQVARVCGSPCPARSGKRVENPAPAQCRAWHGGTGFHAWSEVGTPLEHAPSQRGEINNRFSLGSWSSWRSLTSPARYDRQYVRFFGAGPTLQSSPRRFGTAAIWG